jgi:hypothetical protein
MKNYYTRISKSLLIGLLITTSAFTLKGDRVQAPANVPHAVIYFYQSRLVMTYYKYTIKHNDEILTTTHAQWRQPVVVFEEGPMELSATTEVTRKLKLDIKMGENYYVSCENGAGMVILSPRMKLENESAGIKNYNKAKATNKFSHDVVVFNDGSVVQVKLDASQDEQNLTGSLFDAENPTDDSRQFTAARSNVAAVYSYKDNL